MADVLTNLAIDLMAQFILGKLQPAVDLKLHLFVNNYTPVVGSTSSDFTECTAPGYAAIDLPASGWTGSTTAGVASYSHATATFAITGPGSPGQTVYGHYIEDATTGDVISAQLWSTAWVIPATVTTNPSVTPTWTDQAC